jgi:hypothetical protein
MASRWAGAAGRAPAWPWEVAASMPSTSSHDYNIIIDHYNKHNNHNKKKQ